MSVQVVLVHGIRTSAMWRSLPPIGQDAALSSLAVLGLEDAVFNAVLRLALAVVRSRS